MSAPTAPLPAHGLRLRSVDALRGFNMLWIVGAENIVESLRKITTTGAVGFVAYELDHSPWEGFRFEDLIFPLFLFLMGAVIPFSLSHTPDQTDRRAALKRIVTRAVLLYVIGVAYYGGFGDPVHQLRLVGVLQRIAACYLAAALAHLYLRPRTIAVACAATLAAYWALLSFVPIPGMDHASFAMNENWPNYIDAHFLPARRWRGTWDPEGLLSTIPAIATALLGLFAGLLLQSGAVSAERKAMRLAAAGSMGVALGFLWAWQCPIIKNLWTPSYVLVSGGFSALLMALFYVVIDLQQHRRWAAPFLWIGANALTIYLAVRIINVRAPVEAVLRSPVMHGGFGSYNSVLATSVALAVEVWAMAELYRRRIFWRL